MDKERNYFLDPWKIDPEYKITKLRRDDLKTLVDNYLPEIRPKIVLDYGSEKAPYESLFEGRVEKFLKANFGEHHDVVIAPDGRLTYPAESVDVVLSLQVLEHAEDVDQYLREACRVLKPGGILWLTTHGMWPYHPFPDDYWRWTLPGLKRAVSKYFSILDEHAMLGAPAYALMIYMHLWWALTRKINQLQSSILNRLTRAQRWGKTSPLEQRIKNPYFYLGTIVFVLGAIPLNLLMEFVDYVTPISSKRKQSAVYRIVAKKESVR
jgi:SAM-dependent methyltransferase